MRFPACALLTLTTAARAEQGTPPVIADASPVLLERVGDAAVDWTRLVLRVTAHSDRAMGAWHDRKVQEQDALDQLGRKIAKAARTIRVTATATAGDLIEVGDTLSHRLKEGLEDWRVTETRYHDPSGVEMDAELDLHAWLRPELLSLASDTATPLPSTGPTGVVIDARGVSFEPCVVPTVSTPSGRVLVDASSLSAQAVRSRTPVLYLSAPGDPRVARRAGAAPLFLRASSADGCAVVLDPADARSLGAHPEVGALVANARIVLLVGR